MKLKNNSLKISLNQHLENNDFCLKSHNNIQKENKLIIKDLEKI